MSCRATLLVPLALALAWSTRANGADLAALRKVLLQPSDRSYGLRVPNSDARLKAIRELSADGSPEAVAILRDFLTTHGLNGKLKQQALVTLGTIGSKEAVEAVGRFEAWSRTCLVEPPPFRFGKKDYVIYTFTPHELKPLAKAADGEKAWAVFVWSRYGRADLWLTWALGDDTWAQPILVDLPKPIDLRTKQQGRLEAKGEAIRLVVGEQTIETSVKTLLADADGDGLPDAVEARLLTDPRKPDTDGDGLPDGKDSNPLTPRHKKTDDVTDIRQAVFTVLFATPNTQDAVIMVEKRGGSEKAIPARSLDTPEGHFTRQEYYGCGGFVLRSRGIRSGFVNVTDITVRIESPTSATATISDWEGMAASSGHEAKLRKLHGKWVVVRFAMAWIS